ncbi:hypothetical protein EF384_03455 [Aerococcus agrisoli]|uniref:HEAT repeat domain-containing protein n=2 Tax=Aerococcus agrisoli TaxID=2487350 RepID=A0A3N4GQM8_9LACT|nr:hypothetical protein EF384_03455 [Aerococcus agrisoli]
MNLFFSVTLYTMAALTVAIILSFFYFAHIRKQKRIEKDIRDAYIQKNHRAWFNFLYRKEPLDKQLLWENTAELKAIESILLSYNRNTQDSVIRDQTQFFADKYLTEDYQKKLSNRRWSVRMNTLRRVAGFHMTTLNTVLRDMMDKPKSIDETFTLLQIYQEILPEEFVDQLIKYQDNLSEYQFKQLFIGMSQQIKNMLVPMFQSLNKVGQYAFIDIAGKHPTFSDHYNLMALLDDEDQEIRIRALKAMSEGTIISDREKILSFMDSDIWQERLMVAKIFAKRPISENETVYRNLIEDPTWWVRNEAARVLSLTHNGRAVLRDIMENSDDKYAVDVSRAFLLKTKGGIA